MDFLEKPSRTELSGAVIGTINVQYDAEVGAILNECAQQLRKNGEPEYTKSSFVRQLIRIAHRHLFGVGDMSPPEPGCCYCCGHMRDITRPLCERCYLSLVEQIVVAAPIPVAPIQPPMPPAPIDQREADPGRAGPENASDDPLVTELTKRRKDGRFVWTTWGEARLQEACAYRGLATEGDRGQLRARLERWLTEQTRPQEDR